jgi:5-methyltetrahydrofolate--homocysteine methyltransferase
MSAEFESRKLAPTRSSPFLAALRRRALVFDGRIATSLQAPGLGAEDSGGPSLEGCHDHLVLTRPDVIERIHESFLDAGCDVVETCTFHSTPRRLGEWGLAHRAHQINVTAAMLARAACARFSTDAQPRFVAGTMGPAGMMASAKGPVPLDVTFQELAHEFYGQAGALLDGGVDLLLLDSMQDLLEVKAAIVGIERLFAERRRRVPLQVQMTLDTNGCVLLRTDIAAALTTLEAIGVDVVGLNCSTGPEQMHEPVRFLLENATRPVAVELNAGLPANSVTGEPLHLLEPISLAAMLADFVRDGVRAVGGGCGMTPQHVSAIVDAIAAVPAARTPRTWDGAPARRVACVASAMRAIALRQVPAPLLVGERINAQGSRTVKRLLLAEDYDAIVGIARKQMESGAHVLDVCVATSEGYDESRRMAAVVRRLSRTVEAPLMVDSTNPAVIARALEQIPGRAIVNSISMESGRTRIDTVVPMTKAHGAALVALTIDEEGMARTRERKLAVARKIHDIVVSEYGMPAETLLFDALTFTLGTGDAAWRDSAKETIEGIRAIKYALPAVLTIVGVSNVSFGLAAHARPVLNSVFLHHCVDAGLDAAIVDPAHVHPYAAIPEDERELANALIFNRAPEALQRFITHFDAPPRRGGQAATPRRDGRVT